MKKWNRSFAITALAFLLLAALPGHSAAQSKVVLRTVAQQQSDSDWQRQLGRELAQSQARYHAELARVQAELQRSLREQQAVLVEQQAAQRARMLAQLEAQRLLQGEHLRSLHEHLRQAMRRAEQDVYVTTSGSGWLGIQISEVDSAKVKELKLSAERGVLITEVEADSPAAKAGLKVNDVITDYNGQRVEGTEQFRRMVRETPAGRTVQLGVWRDGRAQTLSAQLAERHDRIPSVIRVEPRIRIPDFSFSLPDVGILRTPRLGINGEDLSGQLGEYFGAPGGEGVLVREVVAGSAAEKAGMKAGDVIIRIEGNRVRSMSDLRDQLREHREKDKISVVILRKGAESTLTVPVDKPTTPDRRRVSARVRL